MLACLLAAGCDGIRMCTEQSGMQLLVEMPCLRARQTAMWLFIFCPECVLQSVKALKEKAEEDAAAAVTAAANQAAAMQVELHSAHAAHKVCSCSLVST